MGHDELLAEIDFLPLDGLHAWMQPALRAVVELHKPSNKGCDWMPLNLCSICVEDPGDYQFARDVDYPCPTIQAIEKELG
jgi:hypothetical protein